MLLANLGGRIMSRRFLALSILLAIIGPAAAQEPTAFVIKLNVQPQSPPSPSLRYRLLPSLSDEKPEDAAPLYKKAAEAVERLRDSEEQAKLDFYLDLKKCAKPE